MLPKYEKIKRDIIVDIENGVFSAGEKIYSENDLKRKYKTSSTTVVKALNDLVADGYVVRRQGVGSFVRRNLRHKKVLFNDLSPLHNKCNAFSEHTETEVMPPFQNAEIAAKLGTFKKHNEIVQIVQTGFLNERVWKIQNRYILASRLSPQIIERIQQGASLSQELHLTDNMINLPMEMKIKVVTLPVNTREIQSLTKGENMALVEIERLIYDFEHNPIEFSRSFIHPEYYFIEITTE